MQFLKTEPIAGWLATFCSCSIAGSITSMISAPAVMIAALGTVPIGQTRTGSKAATR